MLRSLRHRIYAEPKSIPITTPEDLRKIDAFSTRDKFAAEFPTEPVADALRQLVGSQEFKDWREVRHVLIHRGLPSRVIRLTLGGGGPILGGTTWGYGALGQGISVDKDTTVSRRAWLARAIGDLLNKADDFTSRRL